MRAAADANNAGDGAEEGDEPEDDVSDARQYASDEDGSDDGVMGGLVDKDLLTSIPYYEVSRERRKSLAGLSLNDTLTPACRF